MLRKKKSNTLNILITGASSGLGKALALVYAPHAQNLHLLGRNLKRLEKVAKACRACGAQVHYACVDVTDDKGMERFIQQADKKSPLDIVIANAGVSGGTAEGTETDQQVREIFETNLAGTLNTVQPVLPLMQERGKGQIAIISSLASLRGMPTAPAYSASKGAIRLYGEGLRGWMYGFGVGVTVVCPGFIDTPMTRANPFKMPLLMSADQAARIIQKRLKSNPPRIAFPWRMYMGTQLLGALPLRWSDKIMRNLPSKPPTEQAEAAAEPAAQRTSASTQAA